MIFFYVFLCFVSVALSAYVPCFHTNYSQEINNKTDDKNFGYMQPIKNFSDNYKNYLDFMPHFNNISWDEEKKFLNDTRLHFPNEVSLNKRENKTFKNSIDNDELELENKTIVENYVSQNLFATPTEAKPTDSVNNEKRVFPGYRSLFYPQNILDRLNYSNNYNDSGVNFNQTFNFSNILSSINESNFSNKSNSINESNISTSNFNERSILNFTTVDPCSYSYCDIAFHGKSYLGDIKDRRICRKKQRRNCLREGINRYIQRNPVKIEMVWNTSRSNNEYSYSNSEFDKKDNISVSCNSYNENILSKITLKGDICHIKNNSDIINGIKFSADIQSADLTKAEMLKWTNGTNKTFTFDFNITGTIQLPILDDYSKLINFFLEEKIANINQLSQILSSYYAKADSYYQVVKDNYNNFNIRAQKNFTFNETFALNNSTSNYTKYSNSEIKPNLTNTDNLHYYYFAEANSHISDASPTPSTKK